MLTINVLQKYALLEIRCGVLLDLLISVRASCSKHVCRERPAAEIHGFTSEYLSTQLADEQLGGHFFTTPCIRQIHRKTCASTPINVILPGEVLTIFSSSNQFFPKAKRLSRLVRGA